MGQEYADLYDVQPELLPGGGRHRSLRDGAEGEIGLRSFLEEGGFGAFTTSSSQKARLEVHPLGIGGKDDPVRLVFTADPGPALVVAMSDMRDRFRLVANVVENVDAPDLPRLPVGRAVWKPAPDFATSAACWLTAGAAHHTVMTTAVGLEVFRDFAEIARTELVVIDEGTTVRGFQQELRWNQAYFRLAQGL
ncbi:L-arabinose isomerase family protein [Microbacterium aquimaris]|uniref:L-arabinose isomerase family protein n=1 Tax=Microbacterium aquimaris TaxID=459816 RepID=UPI003905773F